MLKFFHFFANAIFLSIKKVTMSLIKCCLFNQVVLLFCLFYSKKNFSRSTSRNVAFEADFFFFLG